MAESQERKYYLKVDGTLSGPYCEGDIHQKMRTKEILPTDLVSLDLGRSWVKINAVEQLSEHHQGQTLLPDDPHFEEKKVHHIVLENLETDSSQEETLTNLAKLGKNQKQAQERTTRKNYTVVQEERKFPLALILLFFLIIGSGMLFLSSDKEGDSSGRTPREKTSLSLKEESAPTATRKVSAPSTSRIKSKTTTTPRPVAKRPSSSLNTSNYRPKKKKRRMKINSLTRIRSNPKMNERIENIKDNLDDQYDERESEGEEFEEPPPPEQVFSEPENYEEQEEYFEEEEFPEDY